MCVKCDFHQANLFHLCAADLPNAALPWIVLTFASSSVSLEALHYLALRGHHISLCCRLDCPKIPVLHRRILSTSWVQWDSYGGSILHSMPLY
ncbi:hypothetical protein B0H19DRAFT_480497 [Mycena capillaripes]|nr:hypothetical protein B0H19DRAFT_480497 [Mycena capillaripes]